MKDFRYLLIELLLVFAPPGCLLLGFGPQKMICLNLPRVIAIPLLKAPSSFHLLCCSSGMLYPAILTILDE